MKKVLSAIALGLATIIGDISVAFAKDFVIGVTAVRDADREAKRWGPTVEYLNKALPSHRFRLAILPLSAMLEKAAHEAVDIILTNPGAAAQLTAAEDGQPVASLLRSDGVSKQGRGTFGAVLIARSDRADLRSSADIKGKRFAAVDPNAFGGWLMARDYLAGKGIDLYADTSALVFTGFPQDNVVEAILSGSADAGTVRSGILESLIREGKLSPDSIKVLDPNPKPGFNQHLTTRLYPEWTMIAMPHVASAVKADVLEALQRIAPTDRAAVEGRYVGWAIPFSLASVESLLQAYKIGPFAPHEISFEHYFIVHPIEGFGGLAVLVTLLGVVVTSIRLSSKRKAELNDAHGAIRDKEAEAARIKVANERMGRMLESSFNEIYVARLTDFGFDLANQGALVNTQYSMDQLRAMKVWDLLEYGSQGGLAQLLAPLIDGTLDYLNVDTVHRRKDGTTYPVEVRLQVIRDETPPMILAVANDISERKEYEAQLFNANTRLEEVVAERTQELTSAYVDLRRSMTELEQAQAQLIESEKMASLGNLVAGIAHEINTPVGTAVTAASHFQDMLKQIEGATANDQVPDPRAIERFVGESGQVSTMILNNLQRASTLISSFKQVAVDQSNDVIREIELCSYIDEVLASLRPVLRRHPVQIEVECSVAEPVSCYPGALSQIITNLVTNALTHAFEPDEAGLILISANLSKGRVEIGFVDNGKGMSNKVRMRLFEPFFTTKRGTGGSGLGMSIVYNLVSQKLKGQITCLSTPRKGTTFLVTYDPAALKDGVGAYTEARERAAE